MHEVQKHFTGGCPGGTQLELQIVYIALADRKVRPNFVGIDSAKLGSQGQSVVRFEGIACNCRWHNARIKIQDIIWIVCPVVARNIDDIFACFQTGEVNNFAVCDAVADAQHIASGVEKPQINIALGIVKIDIQR